MNPTLKALPLLMALFAVPAIAAPDAPAGAGRQPAPNPSANPGCPGPTSKAMGAHMADGHMANGQAMADQMAKNQMMAGANGTQGRPGMMQGGQYAGCPGYGTKPVQPKK